MNSMMNHLTSHLDSLAAIGRAERTIQARRRVLLQADKALPDGIESATYDQIAQWLATPGWCGNTRRNYRAQLHMYYVWMIRTGQRTTDPTLVLGQIKGRKGRPRPVDKKTLTALLATVNAKWRLPIALGLYAGLRCHEIVRLNREDVTADLIYVRGKGDSHRTVPTHPVIWEAVKDLPPGPLVPTALLRADPAQWLSRRTAYHFRRLGLSGPARHPTALTMHRFRHTFGTAVYRQTRDLLLTADLLRHESVSTTQVYAQIDEDSRASTVLSLDLPDPEKAAEGRASKQSPLGPDQPTT